MGLQSQLNDVSSDSIPLLLLALLAKSIHHLRSLFFFLFHSLRLHRSPSPTAAAVDGNFLSPMTSGLAGLVVLSEQLNVNRALTYRYCDSCGGGGGDDGGGFKCVVCLCRLRDGDQIRKLECRHVFHKQCFDSWIHHLNFNCPLCRSPLVSDDRLISTRRRVAGDLLHWFSLSW